MRVLVIDDDALVSSSLKTILEADPDIQVVAIGNNGFDAIELYKSHRPDIILMDIRMDGMTGIEAAEKIIASDPDAKILFLTTFSDDEYIIKALRLGSKGYILKQRFDSIIPSLKTAYLGQNVYGEEIIGKLPSLLKEDEKVGLGNYGLTERELETISHVAEGLSNKEISEIMYLSEGTVRNYISTILEKLELRDRTQLAIFYYKGITPTKSV